MAATIRRKLHQGLDNVDFIGTENNNRLETTISLVSEQNLDICTEPGDSLSRFRHPPVSFQEAGLFVSFLAAREIASLPARPQRTRFGGKEVVKESSRRAEAFGPAQPNCRLPSPLSIQGGNGQV